MNRIIACAVLALVVSGPALSCSDPSDGCVCTASFAFYNVAVVTASGAPVTGLTPTVTVIRTGQHLTPSVSAAGNQYPVFSDGEISQIDPAGEAVHFAAGNAQGSTAGDYVFDAPGACHCHMRKVSGPDTLVLR
jgi:hypothetical protein